MPLIVSSKSGKNFENASEGTHQAVLVEVKDLGEIEGFNMFTKKTEKVHKIMFRYEVEERDSESRRIALFERFRWSLHEKSKLRPRVKQLLGRDPGTEFDVELLVGTNMNIMVEHVQGKKDPTKTYANIVGMVKLAKGAKLLPIIDPEVVLGQDSREVEKEENAVDENSIPF